VIRQPGVHLADVLGLQREVTVVIQQPVRGLDGPQRER
jgi:hypothetical protein